MIDWWKKQQLEKEVARQRTLNQEVLSTLKRNGDSLAAQRIVEHWIYFNDPSARRGFSDKCTTMGFEVTERELPDDVKSKMRFSAHLERLDFVKQPEIDDLVEQLVRVAHEFGEDYDGWETIVVRDSDTSPAPDIS